MNYPELRFRDSSLLIGTIYNDIEPAYMPPNSKVDEREKLSREHISKALDEYEKAWRRYEQKLVRGMCELLNLEFKLNVIDVYAAPFYESLSFPLFIATKYEPDRAVEVITHELLHILLYDNTTQELDLSARNKKWKTLFSGVDDWTTLIHIPVHAALQALFDDILSEPERTLRDKLMCEKYPPYKQAWDYVEKHGYKSIVKQIKDMK